MFLTVLYSLIEKQHGKCRSENKTWVKLTLQDWVITDSGITNVPFAYITQEGKRNLTLALYASGKQRNPTQY